MFDSGKLHILLDGQFGSTGKGLYASFLAEFEHIDISISNAAPNAGHTFYFLGKKYVVKHLPVSAFWNKRNTIFLCAGAIIDPDILLQEIEIYDVDPDRIIIHPRAAVIENLDKLNEGAGSAAESLASTQSGVGQALSRKINRSSTLAQGCAKLQPFIREFDLAWHLDQRCTAFMEVPQGLDLSINSGLAYPHCTSREITVASALSDVGIHPSYLGKVFVSIRTFPIRVGNIVREGEIKGYSGPFYQDSVETSWEKLGVKEELTTVTKRVRRVASFSHIQYQRMLKILKPDYILLNFANYLSEDQLQNLLTSLPEVTHLGFGPINLDIISL